MRYVVELIRSKNYTSETIATKGEFDTLDEARQCVRESGPTADQQRNDPYWYGRNHYLAIWDREKQRYA